MDGLICDLKKVLLLGFARITKVGFISLYDQASCFVNLCQKKGVGRISFFRNSGTDPIENHLGP